MYHVFDQDLDRQAKIAEAEKDVETPQKKEPVTIDIDQVKSSQNSPLTVIQKYTKELQDLDQKTKASSDRDQLIARKVRKYFDFDTLARESLGTHWYQINKDDQKEYSDLFISLIERSYLARSKNLVGNYELRFENEVVKKNKASVNCIVKKDDVDVDIVYQLHQKNGQWMIYNIVFDQVDLIKNYQSQFGRIIAKSQFTGLVNTMRKKLNSDDVQVQL